MTKLQTIDGRHSELDSQMNKSITLFIAALFALAMSIPKLSHHPLWAFPFSFGLLGAILGAVFIIRTHQQSQNLVDEEERRKEQAEEDDERDLYESARPVSRLRIEYVRDRQTQIHDLALDMDEEELSEFVRAILSNRGAMTKRMLKRRTNISNVDGRYTAWLAALKRVEAVEQVGVTYHVTELGEKILDELLPR